MGSFKRLAMGNWNPEYRKNISFVTKWATSLALVATLVTIYDLCSFAFLDKFFFPRVKDIYVSLIRYCFSYEFLFDLLHTLIPIFISIIVSVPLAIALAFFLFKSKLLSEVVKQMTDIAIAIPLIAFSAHFLIIFGVGIELSIGMVGLYLLLVLINQALDAVLAVPSRLLDVLTLAGVGYTKIFTTVIMPAILEYQLRESRYSLAGAFLTVIIAEFIVSEHGLGRRVISAASSYNYSLVFATCFLIILITIFIVGISTFLSRKSIIRF